MPSRPFFTLAPELAGLRRMVEDHAQGCYRFEGFKALFEAVDAHCAATFPAVERGGWFSPRIVGGADVSHVPPHLVFTVFALYLHLAGGSPDPVPEDAPLRLGGITALAVGPSPGVLVQDREGRARPLTDALLIAPALTPRDWTMDTYGLPPLRDEVVVVGWHLAAQPWLETVCSGQLLFLPATGQLLDPMGDLVSEGAEAFFTGPVNALRLARHRERLVDVFSIPLPVVQANARAAHRFLDLRLDRGAASR